VLRTEVWAGVQLSKLSAEVHEYEGGLEGARPCVGPQAYVVINCADRRRWALRPRPDRYRHMRQLGYTVGSSWSRAAPRLWTTVWSRAYSYRLDCRGLRASLSASAC
jgi:hypothetical protein